MTWKDLFTTYGSYPTLIILGIGYLIKRIYDLKSKKIEVHYSLFQTEKLKEITNFFTCYEKALVMWHKFSIHHVMDGHLNATALDEIIWAPMNNLKIATIELHLYLNDDQLKPYELVYSHLLDINGAVSYAKSNRGLIDHIKLANQYSGAYDRAINESDILLRQIGDQTRIMFSSNK